MKAKSVWMVKPRQVELRQETQPDPGPGEVLVRTLRSAISAGTELLFYRGEFPQDIPLDSTIPALSCPTRYPLRYGYCAVGEIVACGPGIERGWLGRLVFAFQPHTTHFCATLSEVIPLPEGISVEDAVFLPNMETAVNFLLDGAPQIGESVVVLGQGVVGLLITALLGMFPLSQLITLDKYPFRRRLAEQFGATLSVDPVNSDQAGLGAVRAALSDGADLVYEISGVPEALNLALELAGYAGRVVVGSWYGNKLAALNLGGRFHRSRIRVYSSQVSTLAPELTGRWDKARRFAVAWQMIHRVNPSRLVTQRCKLEEAPQAYRLLDQEPDKTVQVVFEYD